MEVRRCRTENRERMTDDEGRSKSSQSAWAPRLAGVLGIPHREKSKRKWPSAPDCLDFLYLYGYNWEDNVTNHGSCRRRPLVWEGSAKRDFKQFPVPVQKDLGVALFVVQLGGTPPSAKPWKGQGAGIYELVEDHRGDTYRAVYTV